MTLSAGSNIGPYRIIEPVGRGGMASVFKAYEASLDRYVALKVLPPEFLHDPTFAERFRREAQTVARLEHPQIIPIFAYDIDAETGTPWMAMRLISGGSLSQRIKRGRLAPTEAARILKDVADALDYAHSAGVIHRDVKPQNVLLDDAGRVYLADFGIAKMVEATAHVTQTGMITGTPQYMAPEQALGKPVDKSIDIYALGIVAYELFTGAVPFSADTPVAVLMKQATEPMPLPPASEVPEEVTRAILRATAKDSVGRWPTASAFARAISSATTSVGLAAPTFEMASLSEDAVQRVTAAGPALSSRTDTPASVDAPPVRSSRRAGAGLGVVAAVLVGLAFMAAAAAYMGYRYLLSTKTAGIPTTGGVPSPAPVAAATAEPETSAVAAIETPKPAPSETSTPEHAVAPTTAVASPAPAEDPARPLTPAERRARLGRDAFNRRERMAAIAAARRRFERTAPGENPTAAEEERPARPAQRAARTRINLEIDASQPSTGDQINALYAQVLIDNRPYRDFVIRFVGASSFARWKRVESVVVDDVPLSAREITLVVSTDSSLSGERMEGSTRLALEGSETNLSAIVRFYNQFDRSVKFR